ncbi:MAG: HD-GYP domain-containing protein [Bacillota bacterium]
MLKTKLNCLGKIPAAKMRVSDLFITISRALDIGSYDILDHSSRVAYIALEIAAKLELTETKKNEIVLAALVHDLGIINYADKEKAQNFFELEEKVAEKHSQIGAELLQKLDFMPELAQIVYYHHHNFNQQNIDGIQKKAIPLASRVIRLADRIEARVAADTFILEQKEEIMRDIKAKSGSWFDPKLVNIFLDLAQKESFWLNLETKEYNHILRKWGKNTKRDINLGNLESLASIVAHLIDRVSPFTSRHSSGVATIAAMLTSELGFNLKEQRAIRIAGLFHDLGKLIVPNQIIEKKGELTNSEYKLIKQHTFYTYRLLNRIEGLGSIPEWAAFHHERLDGTGYPFRINAENLNLGSRIMAISDVFQALTEDRPYRAAFTISKALKIIEQMQLESKLDKNLVSVLKESI